MRAAGRRLPGVVLALAILGLGAWLAGRGSEEAAEGERGTAGAGSTPSDTAAQIMESARKPLPEEEGSPSRSEDPASPELAETAPAAAIAAVEAVPPSDESGPVRVFGRIMVGDELTSVRLVVHSSNGGPGISREADTHGAYELRVARPGEYRFSIQPQENVSFSLSAKVVGPIEQRVDIEIPIGAIEGHVYGPDGPIGGLPVQLMGMLDGGRGANAETTTSADGSYAVARLPAAVWTVRAGGNVHHGPLKPTFFGGGEVDVVVESGQRVTGVDLHLRAGGIVAGLVATAEGAPAEQAQVVIRHLTGEDLGVFEAFDFANHAGCFALGGIQPGEYMLLAFREGQAAASRLHVELLRKTEVELRMAPATIVRVLVSEPLVGSAVTCQRSDGVDCTTWKHAEDMPFMLHEEHFGPLLPGTYTFTADGLPPRSQTVILAGEREILLVL